MQKTCPRCALSKSLEAFTLRAASRDGRTAACTACLREAKRIQYLLDPEHRATAVARATANKAARFERDPAYKRAFNLWGSTKKRPTKIPPWVAIVDFVPICRKALKLGDEYEIDHIIPISHPLVCGLHVPKNLRVVKHGTNQKKGSSFSII